MATFTECFASYGAKLPNPQWAVSAIAENGDLVVSCWSLYFSWPDSETRRYRDRLSRWAGNKNGNRLLRSHLEEALASHRQVRLVIATPVDRRGVDEGADASATKKTFHVEPDEIGVVASFDGDEFVIDFKRNL